MAHLNTFEFARTVQVACDRSHLVAAYDVRILDNTVVKIRVFVTHGAFIDVFYNADTGSCSYALIENGIGWHLHPFDDPDQHAPCSEISFTGFLKAVETHASEE